MRRSVLLCVMLICAFSGILHGYAISPILARTSFVKPNKAEDIWVYGGSWCIWDGSEVIQENETDLIQIRRKFLDKSPYLSTAVKLDGKTPLTGTFDGSNMYILDDTPLYMGNLLLGRGGIIGFNDVTIMSGELRTGYINAAAVFFINKGSAVYAEGIICADSVECYGGTLSTGDINASRIWFDSSDAPLYVSIAGNILTGYYTQSGGSVGIDGGLYSLTTENDGHGGIIINSDYACNNSTTLNIRGDIACIGISGIEIGRGAGTGGFDETSLIHFINLRSAKKEINVYEKPPESSGLSGGLTVTTGGDIKASYYVTIYMGAITAGGEIETCGENGVIRIYGGHITAGRLRAKRDIIIGTEGDCYASNNEIKLDIAEGILSGGIINNAAMTALD